MHFFVITQEGAEADAQKGGHLITVKSQEIDDGLVGPISCPVNAMMGDEPRHKVCEAKTESLDELLLGGFVIESMGFNGKGGKSSLHLSENCKAGVQSCEFLALLDCCCSI